MRQLSSFISIGYARISIKDQSSYSLTFQEQAIKRYCEQNNLTLIAFFRDDGESSDTFDRPNWRALEEFLQKHKDLVQYLVVVELDRFSRELIKALQKIDELYQKYKIRVVTVSEPISQDSSSPSSFLMRGIKLLIANHELNLIRSRTAQAMLQAKESGRFTHHAPFGYRNKKDRAGLPVLEIVPKEAEIIRFIFQQYIAGVPSSLIFEEARSQGFNRTGNNSIQHVLGNSLYAGFIRIAKSASQPERLVKGLHQPIISLSLFNTVQDLLKRRHKPIASKPKQVIPLRGMLRCPCGAAISGSYSGGRGRRKYLYYFCGKERSYNFPGETLHLMFDKILKQLSFTPTDFDQVRDKAVIWLQEYRKHHSTEIKNCVDQIKAINQKINYLQIALLNGVISTSMYNRAYADCSLHKAYWEAVVNILMKEQFPVLDMLNRAGEMLMHLNELFMTYREAEKFKLMKLIFPEGLEFDGKLFLTSAIDPALAFNYRKDLFYDLLTLKQSKDENKGKTSEGR